MRLFVAIPVPDAADTAIDAALAPVRRELPGARWIEAPNRHVTLKFLGETPEERLGAIADAIGMVAASFDPFPLSLAGLGTFPGANRARVLWVGLADPDGSVPRLAAAVDAATGSPATEFRPFAAHLTVARLDPPRRVPDPVVGTPVPPFAWTVASILLYRSHLGGGPPRYEGLAEATLGLHPGPS